MKTVRVFFEKKDRAKYISHLDLTRCVTRAFARTDLPAWFTEGFNPHLYLTFALPLPLGVEGARESFDFRLVEDAFPLEGVGERLNAVFPPDLRVLDCAEAVMKPEAIAWADYRIEIFDPAGSAALGSDWERFLSRPSIPAEKRTKHRTQEIDLKPLITELSRSEEGDCLTLWLRLPAGTALNLNPMLPLSAFWKDRGSEAEYIRILRAAILTKELEPFL